jgi:hypothetical protein
MNYSFQVPSPYMHPAMAQAIQALMSGGPLPTNCVIVAIPFHQAQHILPQLMMSTALFGGDQMMYHQQSSYYGPSPYTSNPQQLALEHQQNYNYPIVPYKQSKKKSSHPKQPHSNIYNSTSFDSYMEKLSWSRLFDRPSRKTVQKKTQDKTSKKSGSHSSSSSTVSDETIRRVNVTNNQPISNTNSKQEQQQQQQTKGSLPFKYSSEFVPGISKQPEKSQKIKSNDVFIVKKS